MSQPEYATVHHGTGKAIARLIVGLGNHSPILRSLGSMYFLILHNHIYK